MTALVFDEHGFCALAKRIDARPMPTGAPIKAFAIVVPTTDMIDNSLGAGGSDDRVRA